MADEKLYRMRMKEGAHFNEKANNDGWSSAIQFDEKNGLQGPLEYQEVDEKEYTKEIYVEVERKQKGPGEVLVEDVIAPAVADALTYVLQKAIDAGVDAVKTKVIPAAKAKGRELIGKTKIAPAQRKSKKLEQKQTAIADVKSTTVKDSSQKSIALGKMEHTPEEVDQIIKNMKFAAMYIAAGINELSKTIVKSDDLNTAIEMQSKLDELSSEQVMTTINYMLEDKNRDMLDQATLQLFEAFTNKKLIIEGEKVPISNYIGVS